MRGLHGWIWLIQSVFAVTALAGLALCRMAGLRLAHPPRRGAVPWQAADVGMAFLILFAVGSITLAVLERMIPTANRSQLEMLGGIVAGLAIVGLAPLLLSLRAGARLYQLGIHVAHWRRGVATGFVGYLFAAPLVGALHVAAQQFWPAKIHTVEQLVRHEPTALNIGVLMLGAVVVAPLSEELLFRGILFGWLRRTTGVWNGTILCSIVFALVHSQQWPAPIPIFVLSLFLTVSYHRGGSLAAPMTLHALFNLTSAVELLLTL